MGKLYDALDDELSAFLREQRLFFVATAPSGDGGHVNVSPKGLDTFRVLDAKTVAYLDLTGSGIETVAHVRQNGRITLMFCAFSGPPKIVRLYGKGDVVVPGDAGFLDLASRFPERRGARGIVRVALERIATSCGYSIPLMEFRGDRDVLDAWAAKKSDDELTRYRKEKNSRSIDGIAGLEPGPPSDASG
jgi:Pyridoxamine 5'-phosphate oxidase